MEMANCVRCKKLFPRVREPICEDCKKKDEELFAEVKKYLEGHPTSTVQKISEDTGASTKKILAWLREGRLEIVEATGDLKCRQCGIDIKSGQLCEPCASDISRQIDGMIADRPTIQPQDVSPKKGITMHTQNRK